MRMIPNFCLNMSNPVEKCTLQQQSNLEKSIFDKYSELFTNKLGLYKGEEIELVLTKGAKPKFFQPRTVPLVLKSKIENELDRLENEGIITKVRYSEWVHLLSQFSNRLVK